MASLRWRAAANSPIAFPRMNSGATMVTSIHFRFVRNILADHLTSHQTPCEGPRFAEPAILVQQVRSLGIFRCWMVQVQVMMVNAELQNMSLVPRTSGDDTTATTVSGTAHSGSKCDRAAAHVAIGSAIAVSTLMEGRAIFRTVPRGKAGLPRWNVDDG